MSQQDMDRTGCLAGCDRTPRDPAVQPTPGQLLHSLHSMSREDQLDAAQRILEASDSAVRCFTRDHEGRLARDDDERALLLWLHAEAVWTLQQREAEWELRDDSALHTSVVALQQRDEARAELVRVEASRRDWAAIAMLHDMYTEHAAVGTLEDPWPEEPGRHAPCSCLTAEQAAVVTAGGFSLPRCAVHPEADR